MSTMSSGPATLLAHGPFTWSSHWQIIPEQLGMLGSLPGMTHREVSVFHAPGELYDELRSRSAFLIPYGGVNLGLLRVISRLREVGASAPALISLNAEAARACVNLATFRESLFSTDVLVTTCSSEARLLRKFLPKAKTIKVAPLPV